MSTRNNHSNPYSASDIEKYLKGELPAREMHDLEQAALEDPFLADALEGLALHPGLPQDLSDLRHRLTAKVAEKTQRTPIRIIHRPIILAAAILLLLGIGFTFYYTTAVHKESPAAIAGIQRPAPPAAPSTDSTVIAPAATAGASASAITAKASKAKAYESKTLTPLAADQEVTITTPPTTSQAKPLAVTLQDKQLSLQKAKDSIQNNFKINQPQALGSAFISTTNHPLIYHGIVLDAQNHPLAGASLSLNGYNSFNTVTDQHGEFRFSLRQQDSTRLLTIGMVGYNQASIALNTLNTDRPTGNFIHLQPHLNNLDEVVVVGYGPARKETRAGIPSDNDETLDTLWQKATPIVGREAYLLYLAAAKNKLGLDSTITGVETISFEVDRNGILSAFKIEQSLSPAHDAGVIRLINEGPAWSVLKGRKIRAAVTVIF
jgi:hypothetical protein